MRRNLIIPRFNAGQKKLNPQYLLPNCYNISVLFNATADLNASRKWYFNRTKTQFMKLLFYFLLFSSFLCFGCRTSKEASPIAEADKITGSNNFEEPEPILQSLFDAKDRTISEDNIQKLLSGKLKLPDTVRIALYQYSPAQRNRYYYGSYTDEDYLKAQQSFIDTLISTISKSTRVSKVFLIPKLMVSSNPSITSMRETAVRLQADLLLVFSTTSDLYFKYRVFSKDEAKAFATTECMLMDIRTALVPFSTIVTKDFYAKKNDTDANLDELRKRTERAAIVETLTETGNRVVGFMH